jgi:hypothetical protein
LLLGILPLAVLVTRYCGMKISTTSVITVWSRYLYMAEIVESHIDFMIRYDLITNVSLFFSDYD